MKKLYDLLLDKKVNQKQETLWYSIGISCYSASSVLLLLIVTRITGTEGAGIFSIGWAVSQLMATIGLFGTRNYQVADINENFSFHYYLSSKGISITLMFVSTLLYTWILNFDSEKTILAFLLTVFMSGEALADVFAGFFQQHQRLDISGKSYFIRVLGYDFLFVSSLLMVGNLKFSIIIMLSFSLLWLLIFDFQLVKKLSQLKGKQKEKISFTRLLQLFGACAPIFFSAFLTNYIVNTPKNAIELLLSDESQAIYNIIFMPSSIIILFTSFALVPMYTSISKTWKNRELSAFKTTVFKIIILVMLLLVAVLLGGFFLGIPVLSVVYNVDLASVKPELLILLVAGGLNSLATFFIYILTVFNQQKVLLLIYAIVAIVGTFASNYLVGNYELMGAALTYFISILLIVVSLTLIVYTTYKRKSIQKENGNII